MMIRLPRAPTRRSLTGCFFNVGTPQDVGDSDVDNYAPSTRSKGERKAPNRSDLPRSVHAPGLSSVSLGYIAQLLLGDC
jgi:hypothetical protein